VIAQLNSPLPRLLSVSLEPTMGETFRRQLAQLIRLTDGVPGVPHPALPVIMTSLNELCSVCRRLPFRRAASFTPCCAGYRRHHPATGASEPRAGSDHRAHLM
jgi:hypothetical protein